MYDEIKIQDANIVANCIGSQILQYLSAIQQNNNVYRENSLKIHSLIYLADYLDLLDRPKINLALRKIVCDESIELVDENFTALYYLTKYDKLPGNAKDPNYMKNLEKEACKE